MQRPMSCRQLTRVLIYNGQGSNEESSTLLHHALQSMVDPSHSSVGYITPQQILHGSWMQTSCLIVFGGGYDLGFEAALGRQGARLIQTFVRGGGSYLGICAGAYWACDHIQFDKGGPLEVMGERFLKFFPGVCVGPAFPGFQYESKAGVHAVPVSYGGVNHLDAYFDGGGYFKPYNQFIKNGCVLSGDMPSTSRLAVLPEDRLSTNRQNRHIVSCEDTPRSIGLVSYEDNCTYVPQAAHCETSHVDLTSRAPLVEILGTYSSLEDKPPAVVQCRVGLGQAILSGVHLEFSCHLVDQQDVYVKPWMPKFQRSENTRLVVFKDILTQLGVQC
ncbi:hypothetical protein BsWGS_06941 [Bradybaena similaris]